MSREYQNTISFPVEITELPRDKKVEKSVSKEIVIHVKGTGYNLFQAFLFPNKIEVKASQLNLNYSKGHYLLLPKQKFSIQKQLNTNLSIDHFIKDTLFLNIGQLLEKKVPVKLNSELKLQKGYNFDNSVSIIPDSITISGSSNLIDSLSFINTKKFEFDNLSGDINQSLDIVSQEGIKYSHKEVLVSAKVVKFTEGKFSLPIEVINKPLELSVTTFPDKVEVTYLVSLANYHKISSKSFKIVCDYKFAVENDLSYLVPYVEKAPSFLKNIKLSPNKLDFLLEK